MQSTNEIQIQESDLEYGLAQNYLELDSLNSLDSLQNNLNEG